MDHATPARFLAYPEAAATVTAPAFAPPAPRTFLRSGRGATHLQRQLPPPRPGLQVSVIIPAKDEAHHLPAALAALAAQTDRHGRPLPAESFEVIVLANNCTDDTAAVVRQAARSFPRLALHVAELWLPPEEAHVGCARRLLMDAAWVRLESGGRAGAGIIASTDADTRVALNWLAVIQDEIAAGAAAVGGRILTEMPDPALRSLRRLQARDTAYHQLCARLEGLVDPAPADPWPRHHQHFGASLALTTAAYGQVGGLPEVRFLEDEALCRALRRYDLIIRHSPEVQVLTSARRQGRVEVGLSWQLGEWLQLSQQQREPRVDNPAQLAELWRTRAQLRAYWAARAIVPPELLADQLGLPAAALQTRARRAVTFGALWEWGLKAGAATTVYQLPLSLALRDLPPLIKSCERREPAEQAEISVFPADRADNFRLVGR